LTIAGKAADDFDNADDESKEPISEGDFEGSDSDDGVSLVESRGLKINNNSKASDTITNALAAVYNADLAPAWDEVRQNVVLCTESLPWPGKHGRVLTDALLRFVRHYLINKHQGNAYEPSKEHVFEALMTIAAARSFNPITEYLDALVWDGTTRVERLFSDYFKCEALDLSSKAYVAAVSRCFMIGAVRRMRSPGCKFDTMPVLKGKQGLLKSTAIKLLFGAPFYSESDLGDLTKPDAALKLRGLWVKEFAEIDSLKRNEAGVLKNFISMAADRFRAPYGRAAEDYPRMCVFIATVNEGGYLKDTTGGRRYWPLEVTAAIDVQGLADDREQLWAEAAMMEARGDSLELPRELWAIAGERQAQQTSSDPWIDTVRRFLDDRESAYARAMADGADFEGSDDAEDYGDTDPMLAPPDRVHTEELFNALNIPTANQNTGQSQRLRTVMDAGLGWHYVRGLRIGDAVRTGYVRRLR
jgi:predicted P-loop ATPase